MKAKTKLGLIALGALLIGSQVLLQQMEYAMLFGIGLGVLFVVFKAVEDSL